MADELEAYRCPKCDLPLTRIATSMGVLWSCAGCNGRAVTVELLRRIFTAESINPLWAQTIRAPESFGSRPCPSCRRVMLEVPISDANPVRVDVCKLCHFVWFDDHETETLMPRGPDVAPKPRVSAGGYDPGAFVEPSWLSVMGNIFRLRY